MSTLPIWENEKRNPLPGLLGCAVPARPALEQGSYYRYPAFHGRRLPAAARLLSSGSNITALFCANDLTAIGAMQAAGELGRRVPEELSVIGIDDIETCQYTTPMLTTIHIPMEDLGIMTAKILIDRIETGKRIPMRVELPFRLIKRGSCMAPPL